MKYPRMVEGFVVRNAGAKGYGLFATRQYAKGERIVSVTGNRVSANDPRLTHRGVQIGRSLFVEPRRFSAIWYLNHHCEPNAFMDGETLYARKLIRRGEEITADYSLFTDHPTWDMQCGCNAVRCRELIRPFSATTNTAKRFTSGYLKRS